MVSTQEIKHRVQEHFGFNQQEISGLAIAIIITAFIFSFRDWGAETFDARVGLYHLFLIIIIAAISFLFRFSCQKIYALGQGYKAEFKVWWVGLAITLLLAFVSLGKLPLVLAGTVTTAFMVKARLGEFRYGFSYWNNAIIALWGILGNLIMALLFAVGSYFMPESYFLSKGVLLNIIMALGALLPLPQLEGLTIFFGSRQLYFLSLLIVLVSMALLLSGAKIGLILAIASGTIAGIVALLVSSEK